MSLWDVLQGLVGTGGPGAWLYGLLALVLGALGLYGKGRADSARRQKLDQAQDDLAAHQRMNHAETGDDLSDDERRQRLRDIADQLDRK